MSESPPTAAVDTRRTVTLDDFMTGLIAGLAAQGVRVVSIRDTSFYMAVEDAYTTLEALAGERGLELLFFVSRSRLYGDSPDVREGITRAVQRDLVSLDNPEYLDMRLKVSRESSARYLMDLPGGSGMYEAVASRFLEHYPNYV